MSNTTPLSCFLRIDRVDLLHALFPEITVPSAVADELDRGAKLLGQWRTRLALRVEDPSPGPLLSLLSAELDSGEAEAIALAVDRRADLLLIDETRGRSVANQLGLSVVGSVGVIAIAKKRGLVPEAGPLLDELRCRGGLWLSDALCSALLADLGER